MILPAALALAALWPGAAVAQQVRSVVTTADLAHPLAPGPNNRFKAGRLPAGPAIMVDDRRRFQRIDGFGASITDSAAWLLRQRLAPAARAAVLRTLFSPTRGMGLSVLRQPIGSEDLSRLHFTLDDLPAGATDPGLAHFAIPPEQAAEWALVRAARRLNPHLTVIATPWSPPAWMKRGGSMNGGTLRPEFEPVYARYLVRALLAARAAGVPVRYLSIQNEPLNDLPAMASMRIDADQAARFIGRWLGPALVRAHLSTRILALDHSWDRPGYALRLLHDPVARRFIAGTAFHCYNGGDVAAQTLIHQAAPAKGVWLSECSGGAWDKDPPLIKTARVLIAATRHWARAVVLWGVALDQHDGPWDGGCDRCRPLVRVGTATDPATDPATARYTGDLYGLGHAARFVPPGSVRIGTTGWGVPAGLASVAFRTPRYRIVLLVLNPDTTPVRFAVVWRGRTAMTTLPGQALATLYWQAIG